MPSPRLIVSTLVLSLALTATAARAQYPPAPAPTPAAPAPAVPAPAATNTQPENVRELERRLPGAVPAPDVTDILQRSGLVMRQTPIIPHLPPDPKRDQWYDSRWGDPPNMTIHPNFYRNGGLYGLPWKATHTQSSYPYFFGAPGDNTLNADVHHRTPRAAPPLDLAPVQADRDVLRAGELHADL